MPATDGNLHPLCTPSCASGGGEAAAELCGTGLVGAEQMRLVEVKGLELIPTAREGEQSRALGMAQKGRSRQSWRLRGPPRHRSPRRGGREHHGQGLREGNAGRTRRSGSRTHRGGRDCLGEGGEGSGDACRASSASRSAGGDACVRRAAGWYRRAAFGARSVCGSAVILSAPDLDVELAGLDVSQTSTSMSKRRWRSTSASRTRARRARAVRSSLRRATRRRVRIGEGEAASAATSDMPQAYGVVPSSRSRAGCRPG